MSFAGVALTPSQRVALRVKRDVLDGRYGAHDRLPSYRTLGEQHGVALNTVRKALDILEGEGLVYRRERNGAFVRPGFARFGAGHDKANLKCVNIISDSDVGLQSPDFRRACCLVGLTRALEATDTRVRFAVAHSSESAGYDSVLSERFAPSEQGCVLWDIRSGAWPKGFMEWLFEKDIPFVLQSGVPYDSPHLPERHMVFINKVGAGFDATRHLVKLGHRRIGFVGVLHQFNAQISEGFLAAVRCSGLSERAADMLNLQSESPEEVAAGVRDFLDRPDRPTAIVAGNDPTAIGILDAARSLGIRLPEELSVIGYNDDPEAAAASPALTTLAPPRTEMSMKAVELLFEVAAGKYDAIQTRILNCVLALRESTAPPESAPAERILPPL